MTAVGISSVPGQITRVWLPFIPAVTYQDTPLVRLKSHTGEETMWQQGKAVACHLSPEVLSFVLSVSTPFV